MTKPISEMNAKELVQEHLTGAVAHAEMEIIRRLASAVPAGERTNIRTAVGLIRNLHTYSGINEPEPNFCGRSGCGQYLTHEVHLRAGETEQDAGERILSQFFASCPATGQPPQTSIGDIKRIDRSLKPLSGEEVLKNAKAFAAVPAPESPLPQDAHAEYERAHAAFVSEQVEKIGAAAPESVAPPQSKITSGSLTFPPESLIEPDEPVRMIFAPPVALEEVAREITQYYVSEYGALGLCDNVMDRARIRAILRRSGAGEPKYKEFKVPSIEPKGAK